MASRTAGSDISDPDATEFVRFCYRRRRVGWPELYDEMCAVAARGTFRGMGPDELATLGIGFSLFDMPALAVLSTRVIAEEQARRRPVAVAIVAEPIGVEVERAVPGPVEVPGEPEPASGPVTADVEAHSFGTEPAVEHSVERSGTDATSRLSPVPA